MRFSYAEGEIFFNRLGGILPRLSKKNASVLRRDQTMDFKPNIIGIDKTYPVQITEASRDLNSSPRSRTK